MTGPWWPGGQRRQQQRAAAAAAPAAAAARVVLVQGRRRGAATRRGGGVARGGAAGWLAAAAPLPQVRAGAGGVRGGVGGGRCRGKQEAVRQLHLVVCVVVLPCGVTTAQPVVAVLQPWGFCIPSPSSVPQPQPAHRPHLCPCCSCGCRFPAGGAADAGTRHLPLHHPTPPRGSS
jgi:hypothetical protein